MFKPMDFQSEFRKYAIQHMGISPTQFYAWENLQNQLYGNVQVQGSMTPYILEERELRVTQMDIFSRLMMERILWLAGPVDDRMSTVVQAQLLFLQNLNSDDDITIYVDSPGGSVKSGLSIIDSMKLCKPDIVTINTGMAASMGSVLLGAGTKGKRGILPHSRVMLHQVSYGASGNIQDVRISHDEADKVNTELFTLLAEYCDKDVKDMLEATNRDKWMSAEESLKYGIVDRIITE